MKIFFLDTARSPSLDSQNKPHSIIPNKHNAIGTNKKIKIKGPQLKKKKTKDKNKLIMLAEELNPF